MTPDKPQKIKLLRLLDFLRRETDADHPISRQDLCKRLNDSILFAFYFTIKLYTIILHYLYTIILHYTYYLPALHKKGIQILPYIV